MKLIKYQENFYILSNSEITENDFQSYFYHEKEGVIFINYIKDQSCLCNEKYIEFFKGSLKKITHSTQQLDGVIQLNLSEIEELVYGYNVEKMANKCNSQRMYTGENKRLIKNGYIEGFKAHKEIVNDKLFTIHDMLRAIKMSRFIFDGTETFDAEDISGYTEICTYDWVLKYSDDKIIQLLSPKNDWDIEINIDNKIKIL